MKRIAILALLVSQAFRAQESPRKVQFEEASIKPGDPNSSGSSTNSNPGRFSATNVTLKRLIVRAYDVEPYQVEGGPKWIDSEKFTIIAKLEDNDAKSANRDERGRIIRAALQNLLQDRFHLGIHHESRVMPCFALSVTKGGPKLHEVEATGGSSWNMKNGTLTANRMSMEDLAGRLASVTERPVKDATGLKGVYEVKLEWSAENAAESSAAPSIFRALQEQLGLKLESIKAPIQILVIDRAEKPVEN